MNKIYVNMYRSCSRIYVYIYIHILRDFSSFDNTLVHLKLQTCFVLPGKLYIKVLFTYVNSEGLLIKISSIFFRTSDDRFWHQLYRMCYFFLDCYRLQRCDVTIHILNTIEAAPRSRQI